MSNFDFTDLILLVGTNPLPNYVVGKWFLAKKGDLKIWLIHTKDTKAQADKLESAFITLRKEKNYNLLLDKLSLSEESIPHIIYEDLERSILKKELKDKKVHLNYTGGTKPIAIQNYLFATKTFKEISFSYLSAKTFSLIFDNRNTPTSDDLRKDTNASLDFKEIFLLHGIDINFLKSNEVNPNFYYFKDALSSIIQKIESGEIDDVTQDGNRKALIGHLCTGNQAENFVNGGKWLEHYYAYILLKKYTNVYGNIGFNNRNFEWEIDLGFMNGYQLVGFSVTKTEKLSDCKFKAIELLLRLRQLGGDEARGIMITLLNESKKQNLYDQLQSVSGGGLGNILVLGKDDLDEKTILNEINKFLDEK